MDRRSFLKNSIGSLLFSVLSTNKVLTGIVDTIPLNSMDVLLYAVQTKWGDWKIKATKWKNLNSEKLKNSEFNIDTFTMLGIFDNSQIKKEQNKFAKQYSAIRSLHSVDHYQCTINGKNYPISKQATYSSRSSGGKTRAKENLESGYWIKMTKKYSSKNGKKNIKYTKTKEAKERQKESASYIIEQLSLGGTHIKFWTGASSFDNSEFIYKTVKFRSAKNMEYKGYKWRFEKKSATGEFRQSQWTFDTINTIALSCSTKVEFKTKYQYVVSKARELGIYDDITKHMKRPFRWTENTIINEALKYNERGLFQKGASGAYKSAKKLGIFDKVCFHMKEPAINQFTKK